MAILRLSELELPPDAPAGFELHGEEHSIQPNRDHWVIAGADAPLVTLHRVGEGWEARRAAADDAWTGDDWRDVVTRALA